MISDLSCLICQRPAVAVMSTRIDPGTASYPTCATHVGAMGARLAIDCARAIGKRADVIDAEAHDVPPVKVATYIDASQQWLDSLPTSTPRQRGKVWPTDA